MDSANGKLDTAREIFSNLSSKGIHPDVKTYTIMIQGLCEEGLLHEARELFVKMEQNGCLPDDVTFNMIVRGFLGHQEFQVALMLIQEMIGKGFSVDVSTSALIVDLISANGPDPALQELIKKFMPKDRHGIQEF